MRRGRRVSSGGRVSRPYEVQVWRGAFSTLSAHETFGEALTAWRGVADYTKSLVNVERAADGRDGLTTDERDQLAAEAA